MYPMNITFLPRFNCFKQGKKKKECLKTRVGKGGFVLWSLPGEMATVETASTHQERHSFQGCCMITDSQSHQLSMDLGTFDF